MNNELREMLVGVAESRINADDPSHDLNHALRVLSTAEKIAIEEMADLDVVVPAALFHDLVNYPKNHAKRMQSAEESAEAARKILAAIREYPQQKTDNVVVAIKSCSFSKNVVPDLLEAKVLQDADGLEATGAISVMRTFASTGSMKRTFYHVDDPFAKSREPDDMKYALDLFFTRLLKVKERMHTKSGRRIAERRTAFLETFLREFELELRGE